MNGFSSLALVLAMVGLAIGAVVGTWWGRSTAGETSVSAYVYTDRQAVAANADIALRSNKHAPALGYKRSQTVEAIQ